ncbi:hypothetical protein HXX76_013510 [Chlamydomonas incerta]|uniref:DNA (cytosine-5-)-methyltransferase n=1 Tax=Chlamydomonas incerta TaxID=51695 RepID=A0A835VQP1_CHLIN|nr:hypothetical protein HXX76_013510 [Chlamydomonas incerta]|eukprot:KAG2425667.1 hypothetical protein HXX76_013510 [Chlamydomonas incerta]
MARRPARRLHWDDIEVGGCYAVNTKSKGEVYAEGILKVIAKHPPPTPDAFARWSAARQAAHMDTRGQLSYVWFLRRKDLTIAQVLKGAQARRPHATHKNDKRHFLDLPAGVQLPENELWLSHIYYSPAPDVTPEASEGVAEVEGEDEGEEAEEEEEEEEEEEQGSEEEWDESEAGEWDESEAEDGATGESEGRDEDGGESESAGASSGKGSSEEGEEESGGDDGIQPPEGRGSQHSDMSGGEYEHEYEYDSEGQGPAADLGHVMNAAKLCRRVKVVWLPPNAAIPQPPQPDVYYYRKSVAYEFDRYVFVGPTELGCVHGPQADTGGDNSPDGHDGQLLPLLPQELPPDPLGDRPLPGAGAAAGDAAAAGVPPGERERHPGPEPEPEPTRPADKRRAGASSGAQAALAAATRAAHASGRRTGRKAAAEEQKANDAIAAGTSSGRDGSAGEDAADDQHPPPAVPQLPDTLRCYLCADNPEAVVMPPAQRQPPPQQRAPSAPPPSSRRPAEAEAAAGKGGGGGSGSAAAGMPAAVPVEGPGECRVVPYYTATGAVNCQGSKGPVVGCRADHPSLRHRPPGHRKLLHLCCGPGGFCMHTAGDVLGGGGGWWRGGGGGDLGAGAASAGPGSAAAAAAAGGLSSGTSGSRAGAAGHAGSRVGGAAACDFVRLPGGQWLLQHPCGWQQHAAAAAGSGGGPAVLVNMWAVDKDEHATFTFKVNHRGAVVYRSWLDEFLELVRRWIALNTYLTALDQHERALLRWRRRCRQRQRAAAPAAAAAAAAAYLGDILAVQVMHGSAYDVKTDQLPEPLTPSNTWMAVWVTCAPGQAESEGWRALEAAAAALAAAGRRQQEEEQQPEEEELIPLPGDVFAILAGTPCQHMSARNVRASKNDMKSPKNRLVMPVLELVELLQPPYVYLEQVLGAIHCGDAEWVRAAKGRLEMLGYNHMMQDVAAGAYGGAESRQRLFITAAHMAWPLAPAPWPTHEYEPRIKREHVKICQPRAPEQHRLLPGSTCGDALMGLGAVDGFSTSTLGSSSSSSAAAASGAGAAAATGDFQVGAGRGDPRLQQVLSSAEPPPGTTSREARLAVAFAFSVPHVALLWRVANHLRELLLAEGAEAEEGEQEKAVEVGVGRSRSDQQQQQQQQSAQQVRLAKKQKTAASGAVAAAAAVAGNGDATPAATTPEKRALERFGQAMLSWRPGDSKASKKQQEQVLTADQEAEKLKSLRTAAEQLLGQLDAARRQFHHVHTAFRLLLESERREATGGIAAAAEPAAAGPRRAGQEGTARGGAAAAAAQPSSTGAGAAAAVAAAAAAAAAGAASPAAARVRECLSGLGLGQAVANHHSQLLSVAEMQRIACIPAAVGGRNTYLFDALLRGSSKKAVAAARGALLPCGHAVYPPGRNVDTVKKAHRLCGRVAPGAVISVIETKSRPMEDVNLHPTATRVFTVRELMRMHTFPDYYTLVTASDSVAAAVSAPRHAVWGPLSYEEVLDYGLEGLRAAGELFRPLAGGGGGGGVGGGGGRASSSSSSSSSSSGSSSSSSGGGGGGGAGGRGRGCGGGRGGGRRGRGGAAAAGAYASSSQPAAAAAASDSDSDSDDEGGFLDDWEPPTGVEAAREALHAAMRAVARDRGHEYRLTGESVAPLAAWGQAAALCHALSGAPWEEGGVRGQARVRMPLWEAAALAVSDEEQEKQEQEGEAEGEEEEEAEEEVGEEWESGEGEEGNGAEEWADCEENEEGQEEGEEEDEEGEEEDEEGEEEDEEEEEEVVAAAPEAGTSGNRQPLEVVDLVSTTSSSSSSSSDGSSSSGGGGEAGWRGRRRTRGIARRGGARQGGGPGRGGGQRVRG